MPPSVEQNRHTQQRKSYQENRQITHLKIDTEFQIVTNTSKAHNLKYVPCILKYVRPIFARMKPRCFTVLSRGSFICLHGAEF